MAFHLPCSTAASQSQTSCAWPAFFASFLRAVLTTATKRNQALNALIYASRHDDTNHITLLNKADCVLADPSTSQILMPHRITDELSSRPDCGIIALRLDSLSAARSTAHIIPLLLNNLRPLACSPSDTTITVSIPVDGHLFLLMTIFDAFEWMGHTTLLQTSSKSGPVRTICDVPLQKQAQPHFPPIH